MDTTYNRKGDKIIRIIRYKYDDSQEIIDYLNNNLDVYQLELDININVDFDLSRLYNLKILQVKYNNSSFTDLSKLSLKKLIINFYEAVTVNYPKINQILFLEIFLYENLEYNYFDIPFEDFLHLRKLKINANYISSNLTDKIYNCTDLILLILKCNNNLYIDLSKFPNLKEAVLPEINHIQESNSLEYITISEYAKDDIDFSLMPNIKEIIIFKSKNLSSINISSNINLKLINLYEVILEEIDFSKNINLEEISINKSNLKEVNLHSNLNLKRVIFLNSELSSIDISKLEKLTYFSLTTCKIKKLDLSFNYNLNFLILSDIYLDNLDLSNNSLIKHLELKFNLKQYINVRHMHNLKFYHPPYNSKHIDLRNNFLLTNLTIDSLELDLNLMENSELYSLIIKNSSIRKLKLSSYNTINNIKFENSRILNFDNFYFPYTTRVSMIDSENIFVNFKQRFPKIKNLTYGFNKKNYSIISKNLPSIIILISNNTLESLDFLENCNHNNTSISIRDKDNNYGIDINSSLINSIDKLMLCIKFKLMKELPYSLKQNVHFDSITDRVKNCINIIKGKYIHNDIDDNSIKINIRNLIDNDHDYSKIEGMYDLNSESFNISYFEILKLVYNHINFSFNENTKKELFDILKFNIIDGLDICLHGKITRILNTLSSYSDEFNIDFSFNEKLCIMFKKLYDDYNKDLITSEELGKEIYILCKKFNVSNQEIIKNLMVMKDMI